MRLDPTPRPEQALRVSVRLITASNILHLSSDELDRAIVQEQMENPALEVTEQRVCLFCGSPMRGPVCASCGTSAQESQSAFNPGETAQPEDGPVDQQEQQWSDYAAYDIYDYAAAESDEEEELDPMARLPMDQTLAETLLQQLESLVEPAGYANRGTTGGESERTWLP